MLQAMVGSLCSWAMFDVTCQVSDTENWGGEGDREKEIAAIKNRYFLNCRLLFL